MRHPLLSIALGVGIGACAVALAWRFWPGFAPSQRPPRPVPENATLADLLRDADPAAGAQVFRICGSCHSVGRAGGNLDGPNLHGVMGSLIGRNSPRFSYTAALQAVGGRWTPERMDAWLKDPQAFAPGTSMGFAGLESARDRADVIAYLMRQTGP